MNSYENVLPENAEIFKNERREDFDKRKLKIISEMLDHLIDQSRFMRRYTDKINPFSTKLFVESFLSNINEIKTSYEFIKSYFEAIEKLHNIPSKKNKNDSLVKRDSEKKDNGGEEGKIENIPKITDIKFELEKNMIEIISKSNSVKDYLKNMKESGNNDSFIGGAYNSFKDLDNVILRLDSIERMITAYSE